MSSKTSFGQWLKQRRKALDLTREDLAGQIGCAAVTLYKIEADERRPSHQIAALFAQHLNIPPDEQAAFVRFARTEAAEDAAPWGTPFHPPSNLPTPPTLLIGREAEVAAIGKRLLQPESRLLTLTGPPGIGKTRLALQVATQALDDFADGVFLVALAPITDANLVLMTIANTLGVLDMGPHTPLERLKAFFRDKQILLLLDNFEQILAAAPQIAELLSVCPWLKLLVTSRAPLRIRHERQIPVSPLALPDMNDLPDADRLSDYSAVTLFVERAQAVMPDFALNPENAPTVAAICARLDGLPLAIELISARVKLLSPAALLERLRGRMLLQSDGQRDLEPRHRTLNAAIEWSYQLLSEAEQTLFWRLGVFVGGWTLDAANAVCTDHLSLNLLDGLASLLDKNLIKREAQSGGEPRFMLLETIREYALEQAAGHGELEELCQHHTNYFLKLAEAAEAHAFGREQIAWFDQLEGEWDNVRAALTWTEESETGLRLAAALGWFFSERTHWNEGLDWLERMLAANPDAPPLLRAKALYTAGGIIGMLDKQGRVYCEQALALARAANDRWNTAWALSHMGLNFQGNPNERAAILEESLSLFRLLEDPMGLSHTLLRRSWAAIGEGDYLYARSLLEEASKIAHEAGDKIITAWVSYTLGRISMFQDHDFRQAKTHFESSVSLFREAHFQVGTVLSALAGVELALGDVVRAQRHYQECLIIQGRIMPNHPFVLAGLAGVATARRQFVRAAILFGNVEGGPVPDAIDIYDRDIAAVRVELGEAAFAEAWAKGRAMTVEAAVAYALKDTSPSNE